MIYLAARDPAAVLQHTSSSLRITTVGSRVAAATAAAAVAAATDQQLLCVRQQARFSNADSVSEGEEGRALL
jgi:hypothetical protein